MTLIIKTTGDPHTLAGSVRGVIRALDGNLPIAAVRSMDEIVADSMATPRLAGWMLGLFASLAVALAAVGIYGVLSYVVSQRRQEIGIRVAIGAGSRHVLGLVLRSGLALTTGGIAIGLGLAALTTRVMASQLHDVTPLDPITFAAVAGILLLVSVGACLLPAARAVRVSPVSALKVE